MVASHHTTPQHNCTPSTTSLRAYCLYRTVQKSEVAGANLVNAACRPRSTFQFAASRVQSLLTNTPLVGQKENGIREIGSADLQHDDHGSCLDALERHGAFAAAATNSTPSPSSHAPMRSAASFPSPSAPASSRGKGFPLSPKDPTPWISQREPSTVLAHGSLLVAKASDRTGINSGNTGHPSVNDRHRCCAVVSAEAWFSKASHHRQILPRIYFRGSVSMHFQKPWERDTFLRRGTNDCGVQRCVSASSQG